MIAHLLYIFLFSALQMVVRDFEGSLANIIHLVIGFGSTLAINASLNSAEEINKLIQNGKLILKEMILGMPS